MRVDYEEIDNEPQKFSELSAIEQIAFRDRQLTEEFLNEMYGNGKLDYNTYIQAMADLKTRKISGNP